MIRLLIAILIALPSVSHAYKTSCGARLPNGEELMFELPSESPAMLDLQVGKPFAMRQASIIVKKYKISGGVFGKKVISIRDGTNFDLRYRQSFMDQSGYSLSADMPEISLKLENFPIDCLSYM
ncbi:MAG: hypothetical protein V4760_19485 [Bdellovibrionota bacterium]